MKFISTRGAEKVTGAEVVLKGIAANGGLYVPEKFPAVTEGELDEMCEMSYAERVAKIISKFFPEFNGEELLHACEEAYSKFGVADAAPLVRLDDGVYMLELFHGTTCSYKDMSTVTLACLAEKATDKNKLLLTDSAESGKSAMEIFKDRENYSVLAFYPTENISKMQKLQLGIQDGSNVLSVAVKGSADDCQNAVKDAFLNEEIKSASEGKTCPVIVNSLNFGVIVPQIAYYFSAYLDLLSSEQIEKGEEVDFCVPCGNFSNAVSAYYAKKIGLPIRRIHCAVNDNNALADFFKSGEYDAQRELLKTTSPSMDTLFSANFERVLFEISGRDYRLISKRMTALREEGKFTITEEELKQINEIFDCGSATEETCVEAMYDVFVDTGYTMDTHTGCAMKVAVDWFEKNKKDETKMVIVAVANPYKFPQDVLYAVTGNDVKDSFKGIKRLHAATAMAVPKCLKDLRDKPLRFTLSIDKKKVPEEILNYIK